MDLQIAIGQLLDPLGSCARFSGAPAGRRKSQTVGLFRMMLCFTVFTLPDLEAVLEKLLQNIRGRFLKRTRRSFNLTHPGENEYTAGIALEVVG
jgi:hypothetical protein